MKIRLTQTHKPLSVFSYSSLTDIVLLLLIFFLLTSSFIATEGLPVVLPKAEHAQSSDRRDVTVTLYRDGRMYVNETPATDSSLRDVLANALTEPSGQTIILSSDKEVPVARAVRVMDVSRGLGAYRFFISTSPPVSDDEIP
ncbi:MAG: biopolymer transporter ExbD [Bacteroidota bacterium]|nr:biopolymer transporter ExbD [Bacteroidota bacterium]